jgi:hypothetical protein
VPGTGGGDSGLQPRELSGSTAGRRRVEAAASIISPAKSCFDFPVVGALLRSWNAVPVDRDGGGAAGLKILDRLLAGGGIILFPEGTRTRDGKLQPARSGIGLVVIKSNAPVVPVRCLARTRPMGAIKISAP